MKRADLIIAKLKRLSKATRNTPTADDFDLMIEMILDNKLTDAEIDRAYAHFRDAPEPWWPKPGEFLAAARPIASKAVVGDEGNTLFDLIKDNTGQVYGPYTPEGTFRDRRLIEQHHGIAAGIAFAAAGGSPAFGSMTERSEPFIRKAFCAAYADARRDHGAPLTLDPSRILPASVQAPALAGDMGVESEGEGRAAFRALMDELRKRTGVGV